MKQNTEIKSLDDLLNSEEYDSSRFGSSSDDWMQDPERMERIHEAAEYGGDGSTHQEHIDDWRDMLEWIDIPDDVKESIRAEIDDCEQWHIENGSIDDVIG